MITRNALFSVPSADASADNKLTIAVGDEANRRVQVRAWFMFTFLLYNVLLYWSREGTTQQVLL